MVYVFALRVGGQREHAAVSYRILRNQAWTCGAWALTHGAPRACVQPNLPARIEQHRSLYCPNLAALFLGARSAHAARVRALASRLIARFASSLRRNAMRYLARHRASRLRRARARLCALRVRVCNRRHASSLPPKRHLWQIGTPATRASCGAQSSAAAQKRRIPHRQVAMLSILNKNPMFLPRTYIMHTCVAAPVHHHPSDAVCWILAPSTSDAAGFAKIFI
jgi:hypothetical protein